MNQRLLVIIAVLLLMVGAIGLMLSGETPVETVAVTRFVTLKALQKGEAIAEESYQKEVLQLPSSDTRVREKLPEVLEAYQASEDIPVGTELSSSNIQRVTRTSITLQQGYVEFPVAVRSTDIAVLSQLKKGDEVDIYLRYFIMPADRDDRRFTLVDRGGKRLDNGAVKMVRIVEARRFFSLAGGESSMEINGKTVSVGMVKVELDGKDIANLYAVKHLGEAVIFPVNTLSRGKSAQALIPEMITEIRGGVRK